MAAEAARRAAEAERQEAARQEMAARTELSKVEEEADAITVEEAQILPLERHEEEEAAEAAPNPILALSPLTWSTIRGVNNDFWDSSPSLS